MQIKLDLDLNNFRFSHVANFCDGGRLDTQ